MISVAISLNSLFTPEFIFTVIRVTTPILFGAMAAVICNKAGVINIALEGVMLMAALLGVLASGFTQNLLVGAAAGIFGGLFISFLLAYFALYLKTDIVLAGIALNLTTIGGTVFLMFAVTGDKGATQSVQSLQFPRIDIPLLQDIPFIGAAFSGHNLITYMGILAVFFVFFLLYKTPFGLRIRAVGENPDAARSVGIDVSRVQLISLLISGVIASFGGMYMSMAYLNIFTTNMVAGRGFIAMAAAAMGQANPIGTTVASFLFGTMEAFGYQLQSQGIPSQFINSIPYVSVIIGLVAYSIYSQAQIKRKKEMKLKEKEAS